MSEANMSDTVSRYYDGWSKEGAIRDISRRLYAIELGQKNDAVNPTKDVEELREQIHEIFERMDVRIMGEPLNIPALRTGCKPKDEPEAKDCTTCSHKPGREPYNPDRCGECWPYSRKGYEKLNKWKLKVEPIVDKGEPEENDHYCSNCDYYEEDVTSPPCNDCCVKIARPNWKPREPTYTSEQWAVFKAARVFGMKYATRDRSGDIAFWSRLPVKLTVSWERNAQNTEVYAWNFECMQSILSWGHEQAFLIPTGGE